MDNGSFRNIKASLVPTETPDCWPSWRPVVGRDTFSLLAPALDPRLKKLATPSFWPDPACMIPNMWHSRRNCKRHSWLTKLGSFSLDQLVWAHKTQVWLSRRYFRLAYRVYSAQDNTPWGGWFAEPIFSKTRVPHTTKMVALGRWDISIDASLGVWTLPVVEKIINSFDSFEIHPGRSGVVPCVLYGSFPVNMFMS